MILMGIGCVIPTFTPIAVIRLILGVFVVTSLLYLGEGDEEIPEKLNFLFVCCMIKDS